MKKSLVLAMAMALGVTASAYAQNPFSDVPAGHWAYDSIEQLVEEGVIDGYPSGTFGGNQLMTRYEMAQIVARAMANGVNVDMLAAEFYDELDTLGVRVANLERKSDNVRITGQIRASYADYDGQQEASGRLRTRLYLNGQINDDWSYTGRFENNQYFTNNKGDEDVDLNWAYVSGRFGGMKLDAGRQDIMPHYGNVLEGRMDAVKMHYGDKIKLFGMIGKAIDNGEWDQGVMDSGDRLYIVDLSGKIGVFNTYATYYNADTLNNNEILNLGMDIGLGKDIILKGEWLNGSSDLPGDENGYGVGLAYKGAKASKVGSWGFYADYYDQPLATYLEHTIDSYAALPSSSNLASGDGFKGYGVGANVTVAKNVVAGVKYYDLEGRESNDDAKTLWSELVFSF